MCVWTRVLTSRTAQLCACYGCTETTVQDWAKNTLGCA